MDNVELETLGRIANALERIADAQTVLALVVPMKPKDADGLARHSLKIARDACIFSEDEVEGIGRDMDRADGLGGDPA